MALRLRARSVSSSSIPVTALRAACLSLIAVCWPSSAAAQLGTITGTVRDAVTRAPIQIEVALCPEEAAPCRTALTNDSGTYLFSAPPGTYYVLTRNNAFGSAYTNEIYNDILCPGPCNESVARRSGAPLVVATNATVVASFDLDRGGAIAGVATSAANGAPLVDVTIEVYRVIDDWPRPVGTAYTNASGAYLVQGLPGGRYYARTGNSQEPRYVDEIYDNIACGHWCRSTDITIGTPIDVVLGVTTEGRNFALDPGGRITGTVTDAASATPLAVCVYIFADTGDELRDAGQDCTDANGAYEVTGLPTGSYLAFSEGAYQSNHVSELYDNIPCPVGSCDISTGTPIAVTAGATSAGRDFALERGGEIQGGVTDAGTGEQLTGMYVFVVRRDGGTVALAGYSFGGPSGYRVRGLPPGTYYAYTDNRRYQNEIFDDIRCRDTACTPAELASVGTPIVVTAAATVPGIDFALRNDIAPGAPDRVRAVVTGSTVSLSWSPPYAGGPPTGYVLEAGLAPGTTIVSIPTTSPAYVAAGVGPGRYYVRVKAVNAYGSSEASDEVAVLVTAGGTSPPPFAPTWLSGWMSGARLTLTWGAPASSAGITGYLVEAGSATGVTNIAAIGVNARSLTYIPVPAGYYFVRVRAMNTSGLGPPSGEVLINSGLVAAPPGAPQDLTQTVTGSSVSLSWEPPFESTVQSYLVRAGSAPGLSNLAQVNTGSTSSNVSFDGVPRGTYYVRVHAVNNLGPGPASNEVIVIVR